MPNKPFSPLEQRVIDAVQRDAAVPPKPYEEMSLEEGLAWCASLDERHHDPYVAAIRSQALNILLGLSRNSNMTDELLDRFLNEAGTHEGRCALVNRFMEEERRLGRGR
jgi:hypothetical protein